MDEILKKLLESELLSEDAKKDITESFNAAVTALKEQMREQVELSVRSELVEEWTKQRDNLIEAVDEKVSEMLAEELVELRDDIERFRDLEVEYAQRIVEEKKKMAEQLATELDQLVDKLDEFLEERIAEEMSELKEDLQVVRENEFGRKIFESFVKEFSNSFVDEEAVHSKLKIAEQELVATKKRLAEMEEAKKKANREKTVNEVLAPLSGAKREQMALILKNVETEKLQEAYNMFIGKILKEDKPIEKQPIVESKEKPAAKQTELKTGDAKETPKTVVESKDDLDLKRLLAMAGVKK